MCLVHKYKVDIYVVITGKQKELVKSGGRKSEGDSELKMEFFICASVSSVVLWVLPGCSHFTSFINKYSLPARHS